jgi:hypothetical protein
LPQRLLILGLLASMAGASAGLIAGADLIAGAGLALAQPTERPQTPPNATCPPDVKGPPPTVGGPASPDLSDRLADSKGVICPPAGVDPDMHVPPPPGGAMKVIPPPGAPGGDRGVEPK